jgi:hypothetical protein
MPCLLRPNSWDKSLKNCPPCYSQSPLLTNLLPPPLSKSGLKLVCNVNIVYGNLKSENTQDCAQKPQRSCKFMNSASVHKVHTRRNSSLHDGLTEDR